MTDNANERWTTYLADLPPEWQELWTLTLTQPIYGELGVTGVLGEIISRIAEGGLALNQARQYFRPLYIHPLLEWSNYAEFIAIAVASDHLSTSTTQDIRTESWNEIRSCYRRIILTGARRTIDRSSH